MAWRKLTERIQFLLSATKLLRFDQNIINLSIEHHILNIFFSLYFVLILYQHFIFMSSLNKIFEETQNKNIEKQQNMINLFRQRQTNILVFIQLE